MSDDEADPELLALLAQSLGITQSQGKQPPKIHVLRDAEFIYDNATDVAIDMKGTKTAVSKIRDMMQAKSYSTETWSQHELHPKTKDESTVHFIFLLDLLNFSFWSSDPDPQQVFAVDFRGKRRTGYYSLVACIQRALEEGVPLTDSSYWINEEECTDEKITHVFRSDTSVQIPLLEERIHVMREAGSILKERFQGSFLTCIEEAAGSAAALVNLLVDNFPCFDDRHVFEERTVSLHKRAQILVADMWACFNGQGFGRFDDIDDLTMFADYRIPQMLHTLGCLTFSPKLESAIRRKCQIDSGHSWEVQLRGCSIWCVELIRRDIKRQDATSHVNAVLIDFFLYDTMKEMEASGAETIPHHRTRSIWY